MNNQSVSLVLEFNHVLDSSVAVVDIHSADLREDEKTSSGEEWKTWVKYVIKSMNQLVDWRT